MPARHIDIPAKPAPYKVRIPDADLNEMMVWLKNNESVTGEWYFNYDYEYGEAHNYFFFTNEKTAILFKLHFS